MMICSGRNAPVLPGSLSYREFESQTSVRSRESLYVYRLAKRTLALQIHKSAQSGAAASDSYRR